MSNGFLVVVKRPADKWCEIIILQFINFPWKSLKIVKLRYSRDSDTNSYSMITRSNSKKKIPWPFFSLFQRPKGGASHFSLVKLPTQNYALYSLHSCCFTYQTKILCFIYKKTTHQSFWCRAHCLKNTEKVSFYNIASEARA